MQSKRTRFFRGVSLWLTLALVCGLLFALPISASAATDPATPAPNVEIDVKKIFSTQAVGKWPNITAFNFTLTPLSYGNGPANPHTTYTAANLPMPGGATGAQTVTVSGFSATDATGEQIKNNLLAAITYNQMGVYTYTLAETVPTPAVGGVTYDTTTRYINVYVENVLDADTDLPVIGTDGKPVVTVKAITVYKGTNAIAPATPDAGTDTPDPDATDGKTEIVTPPDGSDKATLEVPFENDYSVSEFKVSKQVKGGLADVTKPFDFNIALKTAAGAADINTYHYTIYNADDTVASTGTTDASGTSTVQLKHGQYVIVNAPIGNKVTVTETDASAGTYKTSIAGTHGTVTPAPVTDATANRTLGEQALADGTNQQSFVNTLDAITPTGVFMDVWPYVLIVALAVFGVVVWLVSKKKHQKNAGRNGSGL